VYPIARTGIDLMTVLDRERFLSVTNHWTYGQPLEDGTLLATFLFTRPVDETAPLGTVKGDALTLMSGEHDRDALVTASTEETIALVRSIVEQAHGLI
jgi:hypothetical protein